MPRNSAQESPAVADKPARRESMPKIAPIRLAYNVVAESRPIENALGLVKTGGKIREALSDFDPPTNSILVFRPQATVQSFVKI